MALSRSDKLAAKAIYRALEIIRTSGDSLPDGERAMERKEIIAELSRREMILFDTWERGLRSSGIPRWQDELERHSSNYVNADFLRKGRIIWYLTRRGSIELDYGDEHLFAAACAAYERHIKLKRGAQ
jgi:hypothetical protein